MVFVPDHRLRLRRGGRPFWAVAVLTALLAFAADISTLAAKPQRVVSMNLCTDQLLIMLADREQIASVSYLAADPRSSALADAAQGLVVNHGLSEEILPMNPDLVLAGTFTTRPTVFLLRKLGYRVVELPVASTLEDIRSNIRSVAEAVGRTDRGTALIAAFDRKLAQQRQTISEPRPMAVLYWANGFTSGVDTLANAAVEAAGFRTLGRVLELKGTVQLPLEALLTVEADVLIMGRKRDGAALANETFRHPALKRAFAAHSTVSVPDHLWICGTPFVADAIERLSKLREGVQENGKEGG